MRFPIHCHLTLRHGIFRMTRNRRYRRTKPVLAWDKIRHPERYPVPVEVAEQEDELAVA